MQEIIEIKHIDITYLFRSITDNKMFSNKILFNHHMTVEILRSLKEYFLSMNNSFRTLNLFSIVVFRYVI